MVNHVANQTYDLALTGFSQTVHRFSIVDFSYPLQMSSLRLMYFRNNEIPNFVLYIKSFLPDAWLAGQCLIQASIPAPTPRPRQGRTPVLSNFKNIEKLIEQQNWLKAFKKQTLARSVDID